MKDSGQLRNYLDLIDGRIMEELESARHEGTLSGNVELVNLANTVMKSTALRVLLFRSRSRYNESDSDIDT